MIKPSLPRRRGQIAIGLGVLAAALAFLSVALIAARPENITLDAWGLPGYDALFALVFAAVGVVVAIRRPENAVGWLFLIGAVTSGLQTVSASYASFAASSDPQAASVAEWITGWIWVPSIAVLALALLLFPTGSPASPGWRGPIRALIPVAVVVTVLWAVAPAGEGSGLNVLGLARDHPLVAAASIGVIALAAWFLAGAVSLSSRMRRGTAIERLQIKWIAFAAAFLGPALALSVVTSIVAVDFVIQKASQILAIAGIALIPLAAGVAILRYQLYEIDRLINRALVYAMTTATLVLTYGLVVLSLGAALRPFAQQQSELAVAGSTLVVAALVQPVRRRAQSLVDRRFYRSRYDAERTVDGFAIRLRDELDLDALRGELVDVVRDTVRPAHASLWLRESASR